MTLYSVCGSQEHETAGGEVAEVVRYLARHGIHADPVIAPAGKQSAGRQILDEAMARAQGIGGEPGPVYIDFPVDTLRAEPSAAMQLPEWLKGRTEIGTGALMLDGKMEDDASVKQCKVVVELARQLAARDPELAASYGF